MAILIPTEVEAAAGVAAWLLRVAGRVAFLRSLVNLVFPQGRGQAQADNALPGAYRLLAAPFRLMAPLFDTVLKVLTTGGTTMHYLKLDERARIAWTYRQARRLYAASLAFATSAVNKARVSAHRESLAVLHQAQALTAGALAFTVSAVNKARVSAHAEALAVARQGVALYNRSVAYAAAVGAREHDFTVSAVNKARVYADTISTQKAARSAAVLSSQGAGSYDPVHPGIRADLVSAVGAAAGTMPWLSSLVAAVPELAPSTLPATEAAQGAVLRTLTRSLAECVIPNCRNTGKFGRDLQDLFGLVEGASLLAFVAAMIAAPEATARDTVEVLDGPLHATVGLFERLVGA